MLTYYEECKQPKKTDYSIYLVSNDSSMRFLVSNDSSMCFLVSNDSSMCFLVYE